MSTQDLIIASVCIVVIVNVIGLTVYFKSKKQSKKK